jgi:diadenosine tetraphosphatase ApaH/serine/threonine PP2A family protein phosphatase
MGNHELALISPGYYQRLNFTTRQSIDLTRELISSPQMDWISNLPGLLFCHGARLVHGSPPQSITTYLFNPSQTRLERLFSVYPEQLCFCGHTHHLELFTVREQQVAASALSLGALELDDNTRYIIIFGSVGQPRDSIDNRAKYAIWSPEEATVELRAVTYDVATTKRLLHKRGFPKTNAVRLGN